MTRARLGLPVAEFSFTIGGVGMLVKRFPKPKIIPSYADNWVGSWAENKHATDPGAAQDIYESEVMFYGTEAMIESVQSVLETGRQYLTLSAIADYIFAPNVNHSGTINCTIKAQKPRRSLAKAVSSTMWEMTATLRAIAPPLASTPAASLTVLRPQYGYEADKILQAAKGFSLDQTPTYTDRNTDAGRCVLPCLQLTTEAVQVLRYVLSTARAASILFPSGTGITYPFGAIRGALPKNCKITGLELSRRDQFMWGVTLTFSEHN